MRIYQKNTHFVNTEGVLVKKYISNLTTHCHSHDFLEIVYLIRGSGIHEIGQRSYYMLPGCFYVVDCGEVHNLSFAETSEYFNLFIKEEFLQELILFFEDTPQSALSLLRADAKSDPYVRFSSEKHELLQLLFQNFNIELHRESSERRALIRQYLSLILLTYHAARTQMPTSREHDILLPRVIDYLNTHFKEHIKIEDLASVYNYNPRYFGRLFQKYYGISIKGYLANLRLDFATELLETTDYTMDEIILNVGFGNKLQFYQKFEERFGCTPKEYKTKMLQQDNHLAAEPSQATHRS